MHKGVGAIPEGQVPLHGLPLTRGSVTGRAVMDRATVHVADLAAEVDSEYPDGKAVQRAAGHRTTLATPLLRDGVPLGGSADDGEVAGGQATR